MTNYVRKWRAHIHLDDIREKLTPVVAKVRRILRYDWGLSSHAVSTIYDGLFVACAACGASIWYDAVKTVVGRRKIPICHRIVLLACIPV